MPALPCDALLQSAEGSRKTVTRNLPPAMLLVQNPSLKWAARIWVSRLLKEWECSCLTSSSCCGRQLAGVSCWALQTFCCTQALWNLRLWHHMCAGCDIIKHAKMCHCCIAKVAYLPWRAVSAPCVSMAQSSWQDVLVPSSSGSGTQECTAVGRGSAPMLDRRYEKSSGDIGAKWLPI